MQSLKTARPSAGAAQIDSADLESFAVELRGTLLQPTSPGYDQARQIWNAMIDRRPALIVRCAGAGDVIRAIRFAREHDLTLAVRGGGHNIAGNATCDGGMVIDFSGMRSVRIDPRARRAHVEPGATLRDFDFEAQTFGLATPLGINSTTGVAGLTLGGGFGWLTRKHGLTIDNLVAADLVTAEGDLLRLSSEENPELFWGIRGGGGNFGIVTRFEFELHRVGPEVLSGLIVFPFDQAHEVLTGYRTLAGEMPDDMSVWAVMRHAPPLPFLSSAVHGKEVLVMALCYAGDAEAGWPLVDRVRGLGRAVGEHVGVQPYVAWQQAFDPLLTPGARNYWKSHNFGRLDDGLIAIAIEYAGKLPAPQCEILFGAIGGAANRVAPDATAYPHRDAEFVMNVHGRWDDPADDEAVIGWARSYHDATERFSTGGVYVNFLTAEEADRIAAAYGVTYERLADLKSRYDPTNLFRLNQNIKPRIGAAVR